MTNAEDLGTAISGFRAAEEALVSLVADAKQLETALSVLQEADASVRELSSEARSIIAAIGELGSRLGDFTGQAAQATEALLRGDPAEVRRELDRNASAIERLRSRLDEATGEMKERVERSTTGLIDRINDVESVLDEALKESEKRTRTLQNLILCLVLVGAVTNGLTLGWLLFG